jgi:hypothetical protein
MRKLLLLFVLSVGTLFSFGSDEPLPPETLDLRLLRTFSAQELYTLMQRELEFYVNDKSSYPLKTQWYTHPVLYSVLRKYTIEQETHNFNAIVQHSLVNASIQLSPVYEGLSNKKKPVEGNRVHGETLEEWVQRILEKDERTVKALIGKTGMVINVITPQIDTGKLISYMEKYEIHKEFERETGIMIIKTLQSKLYGDWETYIQNLLTLYDRGSFAGVYGYNTAKLFAESGDPRCVEKLELAVKSGDSSYSSNLEIGKFLVANGGAITEDVIEKALDYSHDRVRIWGAQKICEMRIKKLYPKVRDLYNWSIMAGRAKSYIVVVLASTIKDFPYWIPPYGQARCANESDCTIIPEDALPLDGL